MAERNGYRGYIGSRPYLGNRVPQHVQNLVIRDYCQRNGMDYLLSITEHAMADCHMMLAEALNELPSIEGIVMYSVFMLPDATAARHDVYRRVLDSGASLHGAVENLAVRGDADVDRLEDIWRVQRLLARADAPTSDMPGSAGGK